MSRPLYNSEGSGGLPGNWVDAVAGQRTRNYDKDVDQHLAKVGVAGSDPVVRSDEIAAQRQRLSSKSKSFQRAHY